MFTKGVFLSWLLALLVCFTSQWAPSSNEVYLEQEVLVAPMPLGTGDDHE